MLPRRAGCIPLTRRAGKKEDTVALISAQSLSDCVDTCQSRNLPKQRYLDCIGVCETTFMTGDGNTQAPDPKVKGGKVFTDTRGGKVFIDPQGGKVFVPPPG
jgi:hypothetical protein